MTSQNILGSLSIQDIIEKDILDISGGANLPQDEKDELYAKIFATIRFRTFAAIDEKLTPEQREEWKKFLSQEDQATLDDFLKPKNIDIQAVMVDEAIKYKIEVATYMEYLKSATNTVADARAKIEEDLKQNQSNQKV